MTTINIVPDVDTPTNCVAVQNVPATSNVQITFGTWDGADATTFVAAGGTDQIILVANLVQIALANARNTNSQYLDLVTTSTKVHDLPPGTNAIFLEVEVDNLVQLNAHVNLNGALPRRILREDLNAAVSNSLNDNA